MSRDILARLSKSIPAVKLHSGSAALAIKDAAARLLDNLDVSLQRR